MDGLRLTDYHDHCKLNVTVIKVRSKAGSGAEPLLT